MGLVNYPLLLQLGLLLTASASRLVLPPRPTQAKDGAFVYVRQPTPTAAPEYYASAELLRRDGDYSMGHDTCGFAAYDPALTYKCYSDVGKCENIGSYRGCCTGELKACTSTFWTQCDDYDPSSGCGASSKTRCCVSGAPYCISWMFSTSDTTYTAFDCDTQSKTRTFELLATPLSLLESTGSSATGKSTTASSTSGASGSTSATTSDSTTTSSISTSAFSSSTDASSAAASNESSSGGSSGSGAPLGAIIGGVVGGVAVIALVILGIFLIRKYQRAPTTQVPPPAPSGPQELPDSGVPSPYPPPTQGPYSSVPQYDAMGQPKYQAPMAQVSPVAEAPNTPATGTGYNRAELA